MLAQRPPLEAQLIDLTDEIAYSTADLDDGFEARLLRLPEIRQNVRVFDKYYVEAERKYPDAPDKLKFNEALKRVLNRFVTNLIENTRQRVERAGVSSLDELRRYPERLAGFSSDVEEERREAKTFLHQALYNCKPLQPEKRLAEKVIAELFEHLVAHPEILPSSYREKAGTESLARVVCDYVAGMTDHYAEDLRKKLAAGKNLESSVPFSDALLTSPNVVLHRHAVQRVVPAIAGGPVGFPDSEERLAVRAIGRALPRLIVGSKHDRLDAVRVCPVHYRLIVPLGIGHVGEECIGLVLLRTLRRPTGFADANLKADVLVRECFRQS